MTNLIIEEVVHILGALLLALINVGVAWITPKLIENQKLKNIAAAKDELVAACIRVVGRLEQTTVNNLKEAAEDGKLTEAEIKGLADVLYYNTINEMSEPSMKVLRAASVDIQNMITNVAEDWINSLRSAEAADSEPSAPVQAVGFEVTPDE